MKKILFMLIGFIILWGCSTEKDNTGKENKSARTIHGKAAIGAFIEEGARVQVRPASVDGVNPANLIEGTVGADGYYEIIIPESVPAIPDEGAAKISKSADSFMENGTGFIIRAWSESAGSWVYSYSENDGADTVANINPYTDKIIRTFYAQMNNSAFPFIGIYDQNIDNIFPSGYFRDNATPVNVPEKSTIDQVMAVMSNMLYKTYNLSDIQNALTDSWEIGIGLDGLLDLAVGTKLKLWLQNEFMFLFQNPDALISSNVYEDDYQPVGNTIHIDIWTAYGNTGNVTVLGTWQTPWTDTLMVKQPDSITGNNHYAVVLNFTNPYQEDSISIIIDDYNSGGSIPIALKRP